MTERTPSTTAAQPVGLKKRPEAPQAVRPPLDDTLFGAVTVTVDTHTRVTVSGPAIPRTVLVRAPGAARPDPHIAIGTRAAGELTLSVDGAPAWIRPGKGRIRRSTYKVDATHDGARYRLTPTSLATSRFTRDGRHLADFSADGDETVLVEWHPDADPEPVDASLGYTLAAAYGTGGQPTWITLIDVVSELIP
ncbi:hypothetical protein [Streptomyces candidus]|uniref:Uncharacterized protein n=1 Tax=Streptomyces candidus TaxID=67283 RepID=A0A7X0HIL0_9ACTN|nr:hypothetical protein [Streptomyces candidus]MBB6438153.1 hypothetical protein [Streptomyces candidus]GHH39104.1 hypothetical protein GCM10018773_18420 [Streptomyces candidus]